jgi:hypothetical protein
MTPLLDFRRLVDMRHKLFYGECLEKSQTGGERNIIVSAN